MPDRNFKTLAVANQLDSEKRKTDLDKIKNKLLNLDTDTLDALTKEEIKFLYNQKIVEYLTKPRSPYADNYPGFLLFMKKLKQLETYINSGKLSVQEALDLPSAKADTLESLAPRFEDKRITFEEVMNYSKQREFHADNMQKIRKKYKSVLRHINQSKHKKIESSTLDPSDQEFIWGYIDRLEKELSAKHLLHRERKKQKKEGLKFILKSCGDGTSVQEAIVNAKKEYPEMLKGGRLFGSQRTKQLLENLEQAYSEHKPVFKI